MTDKKISELTELLAPDDSDVLPVVDVSAVATKKIKPATLGALVLGATATLTELTAPDADDVLPIFDTSASAAKQITTQNLGGGIFRKTIELTNAQIKALPTTPIEIVAAQGAGKAFLPISAVFITNLAVAYGNVSDPVARLFLASGGDDASEAVFGSIYESSGDVFSFVGEQFFPVALGTVNDGNGTNAPSGGNLTFFENKNIAVGATSDDDTALTLGDAANTLTVTVLYCVIDV